MMTFTFFSNYFNHHQKALCDALYDKLGSGFTFVETEPMEEFRSKMGWGREEIPSYVLKSHLSEEKKQEAMRLGVESDAVMIGSAPECFIEERMQKNLLTFRYTERPLKEGWFKMLIPRLARKFYHIHYRNRRKNIYVLGASAYAAADYRILRSYPGKCYKFGYFPFIPELDIEACMQEKGRNHPPVVLWAGRFLKLKRADLLLHALHQLSEREIDFKLRMVGNGEEEAHLKELVNKLNLTKQVEFLGFLSPEAVRTEMEKANIFVMTSNFLEGWGAVIYEALSAGCAVVASHACGSTPWLVKPGVNGYIFKSGSRNSLADKLEWLLKSKEQTEKLGRNAFAQMHDMWNPQIAATRLLELSESLINGEQRVYEDGPLSPAEIRKNNWFHE